MVCIINKVALRFLRVKKETISLKLILLLENLLQNKRHFILGRGVSKPQMAKGVRVIKRESERK